MTAQNQTSLAIIDDHPLYRAGLVSVFEGSSEFNVVAKGANLHDAVAIAQTQEPALMIIDINIPGHGLEAARLINKSFPNVKIIVLSMSDRPEHVSAAFQCGARGFLQKGASEANLLECLRVVRGGQRYVWPELAARVLATKSGPPDENEQPPAGRRARFTDRELDVVTLLKDGHTNREIADKLQISEKTVKHHMSIIMQKLQVRNRVEATLAIIKQFPQ